MNIKSMLAQYTVLQNTISDIEGQIAQLVEEKKDAEFQAAAIKDELKQEMLASGKNRVIIYGWKINLSTSTSTVIEELDILPDQWWKIRREPNLMKIKQAIKAGMEIEGAVLIEKKNLSLTPPTLP